MAEREPHRDDDTPDPATELPGETYEHDDPVRDQPIASDREDDDADLPIGEVFRGGT